MVRFVGCDVHKRTAVFVILASEGAQLGSYTVAVTREALGAFAARHLLPGDQLVLEATTNTWAVVKVLRPFVQEVVVGNPLRIRAIAEAKIKTDKIDARVLAELLRMGYLPRVWQPDRETQRLRRLTHRRAALVSDRTRLKNRLHSLLHHALIPPPEGELFGKAGRAWLHQAPLAAEDRLACDRDLRLLDLVECELAELEQPLAREAWQEDRVRLLLTIPGVDVTVAQTCLAAIGEVARFPHPKKLAAYLGLNPSTRRSGPHCYHGRITKQGNGHARWLLVQAAQHLASDPGPLGHAFRQILRRKNRNVAVVACARKLAVVLWHLLTSGEPYRYAQPRTVEAKCSRLRLRVTGRRRSGGVAQGTPRSAQYSQGRTRALPSLAQVLERNSLPSASPLSRGETAMLQGKDLLGFYQQIQTPSRTSAKTRIKTSAKEEKHKNQLTQS